MQDRRRPGTVLETLNVRLWDGTVTGEGANLRNPVAWEKLSALWREQTSRIKLNCSVGCVLENKNSGELRYFHASSNNATVFVAPRLISKTSDLERFYDALLAEDLQELAIRRRPSTEWKLRFLTNVSFYVFKLINMARIGGTEKLPRHIVKNKNIVSLADSSDKLCFFKCVYLHKHPECERRAPLMGAKDLRHEFWVFSKIVTGEEGVTLDDLVTAEKCFNLKIIVLSLKPDGSSTVVWTSTRKEGDVIHLNLYGNHFSYICNIDGYAKTYACPTCGTCFDRLSNCRRHSCKSERASRTSSSMEVSSSLHPLSLTN